MNTLISEFFDEGIKYIIPGLVAIFLFAHQFIRETFHIFNNSLIALCFLVLPAAWLIGLTVDIAATTIIGFPLRLQKHTSKTPPQNTILGWFFPPKQRQAELTMQDVNDFTNNWVKDPKVRQQVLYFTHRQWLKGCAEKVMYRSLFLIFSATCFPKFYPKPFTAPTLSCIHWTFFFGFVPAIIYLLAWLWCAFPLHTNRLGGYST